MRILLLALIMLCPTVLRAEMPQIARFCVDSAFDQPCAIYPADQTEFRRTHDYMLMSPTVQTPFDVFAWQSFVALNWIEPDGAPAWQDFVSKTDLFGHVDPDCDVPPGVLALDGLVQADGHPLIDQAGNFVVYDTRINPVMAGYIRENGLDSYAGQRAFEGDISFPLGAIGGAEPSVMLKTAWRVFGPDAQVHGHLTRDAVIRVPAYASLSQEDMCIAARVGLVGMHIVTRTQSGNGPQWIWTTFEHDANAPIGANARGVNSIFARELFPAGCGAGAGDHAFAGVASRTGVNAPPPATLWGASAPFARLGDGTSAPPAQISRCWQGFDGTAEVNAIWQDELSDSVLSNYRLVVAQWRGTLPSPLAGQGEVPRYASNVTMESYIQTQSDASCLSCHNTATDATGRNSNFTFLLSNAR